MRFLVLLLCCLLLTGCGQSEAPRTAARSLLVMHTVASLMAEGPGAEAAVEESAARLKELELRLDPDLPTSDIARLNAAAGIEPVTLSPEVYHLLAVSQEYSIRTEGAWDVTVGPLSRLWREALEKKELPDNEAVARAQARVDCWKLELLPNGQAMLSEPGMVVDPGGAAKGLALDEVRRIYARHGVKSGLISLGESSVYALGKKADGESWQIALRHPRQPLPARLGRLPLTNAVLAASGDYEQFIDVDGTRFHHILDPFTGWPVMNGTAAVAFLVSGENPDAGLIADILSTALFVRGPEKGLPFLETLPFPSDAVFADTAGKVRTTAGFSLAP